MALERVVVKTKALHITTLAMQYFSFITPFIKRQKNSNQQENSESSVGSNLSKMVVVAGIPTVAVWILIEFLPGILVFFVTLLLLWVCLGCPVTRQTYKRYLQAANREDFEACYLYAEELGNESGNEGDEESGNKGGTLSNVGKQLVLVNYRHYASVIIFFVVLGLPGMIFYSLCKEWYLTRKKLSQPALETASQSELSELSSDESNTADEQVKVQTDVIEEESIKEIPEEKVMFILDWLPSRITAFGFLLVGHFSKGLPVWLNTFLNPNLSAYDVLAKVAKSSEELTPCENPHLQEPLQMVKLVKRNIIFLLMAISAMTLAGLVS